MKKLIVVIFISCISSTIFSQGVLNISATINKNILIFPYDPLEAGLSILLTRWAIDAEGVIIDIESDRGLYQIRQRDLEKISFNPPDNINDVWKLSSLVNGVYQNIDKNSIQLGLRRELDEETIDFLMQYERLDAFFSDDYLEDYLQTLLYKIHPISLGDGRPGNLNIKVFKSTTPNAFSLPTGMIMISTGLLSLIESEDELIGILSHEVSHFVLDHHISNINADAARVKRAVFWAGVATIAAAATEVYLAAEYDVVPTGDLTLGTAILATTIAYNATERLGARYSREQELEADNTAGEVLKYLSVDPTAFRSVLVRLRDYALETGDYGMFLSSGSHPDIATRIIEAGGDVDPSRFKSPEYNRIVSMSTTYSAIQEFNSRHLVSCEKLVDRNIESGIATEIDYLLKGMLLRSFSDTPESNQEALDYILKAKELNLNNDRYIYKQEGITLIRLKRFDDAVTALTDYLNSLESIEEPNNYVITEIEWTRVMVYKTEQMKKFN